jgi:ADP-ribose pyrophosphatase YjhB (NUDIX family)
VTINSAQTLHRHCEETTRVRIEVGCTVVSVGSGVERRSDERVIVIVYFLATAFTNARLAAFAEIHDALVRWPEYLRPWSGERDKREGNCGVVHIFQTRAQNADGIAAIDLRAMRALFQEAASAGFQVVEIGDFASVCVGARHRQVDRSAAL